MISKKDILIIISNSGETNELKNINPFSENKFVTGYFNIWLLIGFCCNFPSHFKMGTDCFPNIIKSAFSDRIHATREKFPHAIIVTWVFRSVNLGIVKLSAISSAI